jgi:hypothetical protein
LQVPHAPSRDVDADAIRRVCNRFSGSGFDEAREPVFKVERDTEAHMCFLADRTAQMW